MVRDVPQAHHPVPARLDRRRRLGRGNLLAYGLVGLVGIPVGLILGVLAFVLRPEVGLFGDANSGPERVVGVLSALACGPALLAGLIAAGVHRGDRLALAASCLVAAGLSLGVLVTSG
jgi:hypothetical protein